MKILVKQAGRQVQRMRNIVLILALFVCTSICLGDTGQTITISRDGDTGQTITISRDGDTGQTITISRDIVDRQKASELELQYQTQSQQLPQRQLLLKYAPLLQQPWQQLQELKKQVRQLLQLQEPQQQEQELQRQLQLHMPLQLPLQLLQLLQGHVQQKRKLEIEQQERHMQLLLEEEQELQKLPQELQQKQQELQKLQQELQQNQKDEKQKRLQWLQQRLQRLQDELPEQPLRLQRLRNKQQKIQQQLPQFMDELEKLELLLHEMQQRQLDRLLPLILQKMKLQLHIQPLLEQLKEQWQLEQPRQLELEQQLKQLEQQLKSVKEYSDIAGNGDDTDPNSANYGKVPRDGFWKDPNNNHLFINPGAKVGNAYGAYMNADSVQAGGLKFKSMTNNKVIVSGGEFGCGYANGDIAGAWADDSIEDLINISSNTVIITGGTDIRNVFGGRTKKGTVSSSTVRIEGGRVRNVYGGYIEHNGTATGNEVYLTSVTVREDVYGAMIVCCGRIGDGLASSNTVTITGGRVGQDVLGGYVYNDGTATLNTVNLTSVTVRLNVFGARIGTWIGDGLASSNTVTITSGTVKNVYGGYIVWNGTATLNKVDLTSVTVRKDVYGARIGGYAYGRIGKYGLANSNTVTITNGTVRNVYGGYIIHQNGTATENKVNLTSVTVRLDVFGAKIGNDEDEDKDEKVVGDVLASSNTVTITSGTVGLNVYGGYIHQNGTAILNKVNLTDVDITRDVYGAKIGKNGDAISNEVTITDGRVGGDVLGGYVYKDGTATGNKVTLTNVNVKRDVYGAMVGTDKKAAFERAEEEMTESFERVLAPLAKFERAEEAEFEGEIEATRTEAEKAVIAAKAFDKVLDHLGPTVKAEAEAEFKLGRNREANDANFREVSNILYILAEYNDYNLELKEKTERDKFVGNVKKGINKFKAAKAKFKKYVIAEIARAETERAKTYVLASSNEVTINGGRVGRDVFGGYIHQNGTATLNKANLTGVTATKDVYGAKIIGDGLASSNTVTISGGKVKGNVFGGYVGGNGEATYNTINITAAEQSFPKFSPKSILCGGICADATTNDAITGNTLNIETKGVEVKGISNFEKYKFHLKDIKAGETILTARSGGCSWNTREHNYTSDCAVDISRSSMHISLHTQGVLNKGDQYTLIKSPHGFEGEVETKQCDFENEGLLIKYCWDIKIADNKQELIAKLIDKKIRDEGIARSLSEGYGAGVVCVNNGMDCVVSKIEETELLAKLQRKGEIGAFGGLAASKSKYDIDKGSHINMIGMSMMGGVGVRVEVGRKEQSSKELSSKEQNSSEQSSEQSSPELSSKKPSSKELGSELTVGVFAEHGTGESNIQKLSFSGLSPCENKNEGKSSYTGGGLLGRYNIYEDEFSGTKLYGEAILRAGQVENNFDSKKMKDSKGKEYKYKYADAMYGGCALGGGYRHKVSEKIDLDWSLRYMFGRQWEKGVKREDADGNKAKFESVTSNRIRIGVRGKYVELEKIKPYAGIGCECELDGKVKGAIQNGADMIDMPASDFGGVTGIGELGVSGKVWKFGVDISGQGYLGVRKGFGGMLKLKYAFGKDAHGSKASSKASSKAPISKASGSKSPRSKAPGSKAPRS